MTKQRFLDEMGINDNPLFQDEGYAYNEYMSKVQPYLHLISKFRTGKDKLTEEQLRVALGVSKSLWKRFKGMETLRTYLDLDRDIMAVKSQMDIVRAVAMKPDNAVAVKLQAERFDPFYREEGKDIGNEGHKIEFTIVDGKQSDEQIRKEVDIKLDDR